MGKCCKRCELIKLHEDFSAAPRNSDGRASLCKPCVSIRNREYWRTPVGRMSLNYSRQISSSHERQHPPPPYTRDWLFDWAVRQGLGSLMAAWKASDFQTELAPSVDRLDANLPYSSTNIRLVTWRENNEKEAEDRKSCAHITKQNRKVRQLTLDGVLVKEFDSIAAAGRATGIQRTNINAMCKGRSQHKSVGGFLWEHA